MAKRNQFYIQGIYHKILVKVVSKKWLSRYINDKDIMGIYEHADGKIYIVRELPAEVKRHTIYHEIGHHITDTLEGIEDEEQRCDLLGAYLMKLAEDRETIETNLIDNCEQD